MYSYDATCQHGDGAEFSYSSGLMSEGCGDVKHVPGYVVYRVSAKRL
jgi:hypothetical protein